MASPAARSRSGRWRSCGCSLDGRRGLTLVSVGGISTVEDARARLEAGADLLQAYTAFVYEGPRWPRRILRGLASTTS